MNNPVLIIEMPELNDKAAVDMHNFLQELMNVFELHYMSQINQHYNNQLLNDDTDSIC